jgi:anthranilate/para-aminobenzoate synthase component II
VEHEGFNERDLRITASLADGTIMALEHRSLPIFGVQFHPESVLSGSAGRRILDNFVSIIERRSPSQTIGRRETPSVIRS